MAISVEILSGDNKLELPITTVKNYHFDYAEGDNYAKGNTELLRLNLTIDVREILSMDGAFEDNLKLVQDIRDWMDCVYMNDDSYDEYYRQVTVINYFIKEELRKLRLDSAYVSTSEEFVDLVNGKHLITLELLQKEDELEWQGQI